MSQPDCKIKKKQRGFQVKDCQVCTLILITFADLFSEGNVIGL